MADGTAISPDALGVTPVPAIPDTTTAVPPASPLPDAAAAIATGARPDTAPAGTDTPPVTPTDTTVNASNDTSSRPDTEQNPEKERKTQYQIQEAQIVTDKIINTKGKMLDEQTDGLDEGAKAVREIFRLQRSPATSFVGIQKFRPEDPPGLPTYTGSGPLEVTVGNVTQKVWAIESTDTQTLMCWVGESTNNAQKIPIPLIDVTRAQVLQNRDAIMASSAFTPAEKRLLEAQITYQQQGIDAVADLGTEEFDEIITKAAQDMGIPTSEDIRVVIDRLAPEAIRGTKADGTPEQLTPQQIVQNTERGRLLQMVENRNIIDAPTMIAIVNESKFGAEEIKMAEAQLKNLRIELDKDPKNQGLQKHVAEAEQELYVLHKLHEATQPGGAIEAVFADMTTGELPVEDARRMISALRTGDFAAIIKENPDFVVNDADSPQVRYEKQLRHEALMKNLKRAGFGSLGVMALLAFFAMQTIGKSGGH